MSVGSIDTTEVILFFFFILLVFYSRPSASESVRDVRFVSLWIHTAVDRLVAIIE